ncbi:MAG: nucleotidyl transferase AbiEii/AbiGii toxin family protein [Solobacterium sp.]|nr:nucleotidyl transferase AbiEii/AbiGii toxin family protein [Solobacterium sp.]
MKKGESVLIIPENYSLEHIDWIAGNFSSDRFIAERAMYAFGLLEAVSRTGLKFIFKGGSCLMLLLDRPKRLSTDIDIIVDPGTDIDAYLKRAAGMFPFTDYEESIRPVHGNIVKRHFRFFYQSPVMDDRITILLDVLYEYDGYPSVIEKPIEGDLLLTVMNRSMSECLMSIVFLEISSLLFHRIQQVYRYWPAKRWRLSNNSLTAQSCSGK